MVILDTKPLFFVHNICFHGAMCNLPRKVFLLGYPAVVLQKWFLFTTSFFMDDTNGTRQTTVNESALNG